MKQLTVKELIDLLSNCNKDSLVYIEGCDCTNEAVKVEEIDGSITIRNSLNY